MKPIRDCLNQQLQDLYQQSKKLDDLSLTVAQLLPPEFAEHCQVGAFTKGCLVLSVRDAHWASQLRYALPELRDQLRTHAGMYQLSSIKIHLQQEPNSAYEKPVNKRKLSLSELAKARIIEEGKQCKYAPLRKALLELATDIPLD